MQWLDGHARTGAQRRVRAVAVVEAKVLVPGGVKEVEGARRSRGWE